MENEFQFENFDKKVEVVEDVKSVDNNVDIDIEEKVLEIEFNDFKMPNIPNVLSKSNVNINTNINLQKDLDFENNEKVPISPDSDISESFKSLNLKEAEEDIKKENIDLINNNFNTASDTAENEIFRSSDEFSSMSNPVEWDLLFLNTTNNKNTDGPNVSNKWERQSLYRAFDPLVSNTSYSSFNTSSNAPSATAKAINNGNGNNNDCFLMPPPPPLFSMSSQIQHKQKSKSDKKKKRVEPIIPENVEDEILVKGIDLLNSPNSPVSTNSNSTISELAFSNTSSIRNPLNNNDNSLISNDFNLSMDSGIIFKPTSPTSSSTASKSIFSPQPQPTVSCLSTNANETKASSNNSNNNSPLLNLTKINLQNKLKSLNEETNTNSNITNEKDDTELLEFKAKYIILEKDNIKLIGERDLALEDLRKTESAFMDLFKKYERTKDTMLNLKKNEDVLKTREEDYLKKLENREDLFKTLREALDSTLQTMNEDHEKKVKELDVENHKLRALMKKNEVKIGTLENDLEQRGKELEQLRNLCDQIIEGKTVE